MAGPHEYRHGIIGPVMLKSAHGSYPVTVDIRNYFNAELAEILHHNTEDAQKFDAKYQINITGEEGGEWFVDASPSGPSAKPGNPGGADVSVTVSSEDFQSIYEDPSVKFPQLYFSGNIKATGNEELAFKLIQLLKMR
jgi:hypothetical protein